jgi:hypothetical protein
MKEFDIPEDFDFYGDVVKGYDYMLETDENLARIEFILSKYDIKKKDKKRLYNILANIQRDVGNLSGRK